MAVPTLDLAGAASHEASVALDGMLKALQAALRKAMASGAATAEDAAFWQDIDRAYASYDAWIAVIAAQNPFSCAKGCTACCHDNPHGLAGVELLRMRRAIAGWEAELQPRMDLAVARYRALVASLGPEMAEAATRSLRQPCPLLSEAGLCTAYTARPMACRMFHALTPAAWCDPSDPRFAERVNPNLVPPLVLRQLLGAISRCLGQPGGTLWEGLREVTRPPTGESDGRA